MWWRLRRQKRKPTPPRCARQPLPREGAREVIPSFLWKEVPRRLDGDGGVKKAKKIFSSASFTRAPYPPLARSPFPNGEGCDTRIPLFSIQRLSQGGRQRGGGFAAKNEANSASLRSAAPSKGRGSRGHSLLPMEGGAPKGRRLEGESGMKESEEMHLKYVVYESTLSTAGAVPLP